MIKGSLPATKFDPEINRLRAALRQRHGRELIATLGAQIETLAVAALAADNAARYVAANSAACALTGYSRDEILDLTVQDLTPMPQSTSGDTLWEEFVAAGAQRGQYEVRRKDGTVAQVRYWAYASVAPGVHVSLLVPMNVRGKRMVSDGSGRVLE
jgi:PAS domain S-box-containing protein